MAKFEIVLRGFDGNTDKTDHLVLAVEAASEQTVQQTINEGGLSNDVFMVSSLPENYGEHDIDFRLPYQTADMTARIHDLLNATPALHG